MLHREKQCTCCQLVLEAKWLAVPLHHIEALHIVGMPVNAGH